MKTERPFVYVNLAMTADGKIATANGQVSCFGSARDEARLYELRSEADAILCGANTVNRHPVDLGPGPDRYRRQRIRNGLSEFPIRVIVSGTGSLEPNAHLFSITSYPIFVLTTRKMRPARRRALEKVADVVKNFGEGSLDVASALSWLHKRGVRRLLSEGGGRLNDALFEARAVDRVHTTICPYLFGGRHAPTLADGLGRPGLALAHRLILRHRRQVGSELFVEYDVA